MSFLRHANGQTDTLSQYLAPLPGAKPHMLTPPAIIAWVVGCWLTEQRQFFITVDSALTTVYSIDICTTAVVSL